MEKNCDTCRFTDVHYSVEPCDSCRSGLTGVHSNWESQLLDQTTHCVENDPVASPSHYMLFPDMESIEAIRKLLSAVEYRGFLKGNILKYRLRAGRKGNDSVKTLEDIAKSEQYSKFLADIK